MSTVPTLDAIVWSPQCLLPAEGPLSEDVAKRIKKEWGYVPACMPALGTAPWLVPDMVDASLAPYRHVSPRLADLTHLVVAQDSSCRYCYGMSRAMLRMSGMAESKIRDIEANLHATDLSAHDKALLAFARKVARCNPPPGAADFAQMQQLGVAPGAVAEIAAYVAKTMFMTRSMIMCAEPPAPMEKVAFSPLASLVGMIMGMRREAKRITKQDMPLPAATQAGPFAKLFAPYDGIATAVALATAVNHAFASELLPLRSKLWVTAVVARTAQCHPLEGLCRDWLAQEGLAASAVARVLDTLTGPELTEVEAAILPVCRDTVRTQPPVIQPKIAILRNQIALPHLVEFIATCGLANGLVRLSCLGPA